MGIHIFTFLRIYISTCLYIYMFTFLRIYICRYAEIYYFCIVEFLKHIL
jgi:hypothetical protein